MIFLSLIVSLFCSVFSYSAIFGTDDRVAMRSNHPYYKHGRATAVGILSSLIEPEDDSGQTFKIFTDPMSNALCKGEKFYEHTSLSFACSGFLVAPDLLVTAGHCMVNGGISENETELYCKSYSWLFGYEVGMNGQVQQEGISKDNFYTCKKILFAVREDKAPFRDYALVQLDRPVVGRTPLTISKSEVKATEPVYMIGYPMGAPMVYTDNAKVLRHHQDYSFLTDLDAFDGNSGSAVLNRKHEVVGILIGGTPMDSFIAKNIGGESCYVYNRCDVNGRNCTKDDDWSSSIFAGFPRASSEVQTIAPIAELLKGLQKAP